VRGDLRRLSPFETRLRRPEDEGALAHGPRPQAPRSGLEGRIHNQPSRNERGVIVANVSFLLSSRPPFDSTLSGDCIDDSRIMFSMHERHRASTKRVATLVEPKGMFADPLVDRSPRHSRIVAAVCAAQNVDRRAVQGRALWNLSHTL
jgi:hypothetical protein